MFTQTWSTSERKYGVHEDRDVRIPMTDGINSDCDIFRPTAKGKFPAILGIHSYQESWQSVPSVPRRMMVGGYPSGGVESGDPQFYVRRGYVHVICNVHGASYSNTVIQPSFVT